MTTEKKMKWNERAPKLNWNLNGNCCRVLIWWHDHMTHMHHSNVYCEPELSHLTYYIFNDTIADHPSISRPSFAACFGVRVSALWFHNNSIEMRLNSFTRSTSSPVSRLRIVLLCSATVSTVWHDSCVCVWVWVCEKAQSNRWKVQRLSSVCWANVILRPMCTVQLNKWTINESEKQL